MHLGPGSVLIGKYRLEHPLSRGGMGSVWVARHLQLGTPVAVKFMDPAYAASPAFRARFEREARAAAQLKSPHIVQVHDFGIHEDVPYLVMELLQGEDLGAYLLRRGRLSLDETLRLLVQTGKALRSAHDAGLVHRDLKPQNLFLARVDGEDEPIIKLLDFGIAKETTTKLVADASTTGEVMGSPHYMSPEQLRAERDIDARSDLWALGVILFRMLTGCLPFPGEVLAHVMTRILVDPIPLPTQVAPDLPPSLDAFFARALARDRSQRFQSVREMVDALSRIAGVSRFSSSVSGVVGPFGPGFAGAGPGAAPPGPSPVMPGGLGPGPIAGAVSAGTLTGAIGASGVPPRRSTSLRTMAAVAVAVMATLGVLGVVLGILHARSTEHASTEMPDAAAAPETTRLVGSTAMPAAAATSEAPRAAPSGSVLADSDAGAASAPVVGRPQPQPTRAPPKGARTTRQPGALRDPNPPPFLEGGPSF